MKNWTVGARIAFGFAGVIIVAAALGGFAYTRLTTIRHHADLIASQTAPTVQLCGQVGMQAKDSVRTIYQHIGSSDAADMTRLENNIKGGAEANTKAYNEIERINTAPKCRELLAQIKSARADYTTIRGNVLAVSRQATNNATAYQMARKELDPATDRYLSALGALIDYSRSSSDQATREIQSAVRASQLGIEIGLIVALLVGVGLAWIITRNTGHALHAIAAGLNQGADQVSEASGQVASTSQSLAEGASEQAASLEETSSSLEEMAAMTKRNADNARKANDLAKQTRTEAERGAADMQQMSAAVQAIKNSSDDIAKIIRTIDEIAFQTNILALNAAVEAARAGEAGMGFAVVADEVRNLSQRCAQAAKETSAKIASAITKTGQGVEISDKVVQTLTGIVTRVRQLDDLVGEVANASQEQSQGIEQVNMAVGQMDKVTQTSAASAEELASSSQELAAQAQIMKASVGELLALVDGTDAAHIDHGSLSLASHQGSSRLRQPTGARTAGAKDPAAGHSKSQEHNRQPATAGANP